MKFKNVEMNTTESNHI